MFEFIERHEILRLLECISVDPAIVHFNVCQMMTVARIRLRCVGRFSYSWDTGFVHCLEEYRATVRTNGECAKHFFPAVAVVGLRSLICIEAAQRNLQVYCGGYDPGGLPGAPSEEVAEDLNALCIGY